MSEEKEKVEVDPNKVKVMFGDNKVIEGTMYGKGVIELTPDLAVKAIRNGGVLSEADKSKLDKLLNKAAADNGILPLEETMKRFQAFDYSDDVMRSMQYHQSAIAAQVSGNPLAAATYGDKEIVPNASNLVSDETNPNIEVSGGETKATGAIDLSSTGGMAGGVPSENVEGGGTATGGSSEGNQTGGAPTGGAPTGGSETGGSETGGKDSFDLPEGLPYRAELIAGGVTSMEKLRSMKRPDILLIPNIGDARANQIGAHLAAMEENK